MSPRWGQPEGDVRPAAASGTRRRESCVFSSNLARTHLLAQSPDPSLAKGARNALETVLGLQAEDRLVLLVQRGQEEVGRALLDAGDDLGLRVQPILVQVTEDSAPAFFEKIRRSLGECEASILVGDASLPGNLRRSILHHRNERRHGHMVGITPAMMRQSMRADHREVHALGEALVKRLAGTTTLVVRTGLGCEVTLRFADGAWFNGSGLLRGPGFTNLPAGEVVATPVDVQGCVQVDGGTWLENGQVLRSLRLSFEGGRLTDVRGAGGQQVLEFLQQDINGTRVGQVAFGTNLAVLTPIGSLLQDLKMPGLNLILGYSCQAQTGASWTSNVMVPALLRRPDVLVNGEPIMVRGRYVRGLT